MAHSMLRGGGASIPTIHAEPTDRCTKQCGCWNPFGVCGKNRTCTCHKEER